MKPKVALVHCQLLPEPDPDGEVTLSGLREGGIDAEWVAWDDSSVDWSAYRLAILRATWNYYEDPGAFGSWLRRAGAQTRLLNPEAIVQKNLHKRYLLDLEEKGVPIVPTVFLRPGDPFDLPADWARFVVKPAISAGSYLTEAFDRDRINDAQAFLGRVWECGDALVQKFMDSVDEGGEVNLIHVDGMLTHGIVKRPRFSQDAESVSAAIQPDSGQRKIAEQVMTLVQEPLLYARVDLMRDGDLWRLSELELIEPSLFFLQHPPALERFVGAIRTALG